MEADRSTHVLMLSLDLVPIFKDGVTIVVYLGC